MKSRLPNVVFICRLVFRRFHRLNIVRFSSFINEFSFTFKFWFLLYFNLILRPTRETQGTLLDFAEFRFASSIREIILGESPLQIF